jgi:HTH-type transcriptional regulator, sugar sensing transcriptional regulator
MIEQLLSEIGLTPSEIKVYLALMELGSSSAGKIIENSKIASSKIYEVLEKLASKGFVSSVESGKVRYFQASPPAMIKDYLGQKEKKIAEQTSRFVRALPEFNRRYHMALPKTKAAIFSGIKGIETALLTSLKESNTEVCIIGDFRTTKLSQSLHRFCEFCQDRQLRIMSSSPIDSTNFKKATIKSLHRPSSSITIILGDKTILLPQDDKNPIAIVISSKNIADSNRFEFEQEWQQDAWTIKGIDAIKSICEDIIKEGGVDWIGARGYSVDRLPDYFDDWEKRANAANVKIRSIVDKETKGHRVTGWPFVKVRYTMEKEFAKLSCFWIYKKKVVITNWTEKDAPLVLTIENPSIVEMYKLQFENMWRIK